MIATKPTIVLSYALHAGAEEAHLTLYDTPTEPEVGAALGGSLSALRILAAAVAVPRCPDNATRPAILAQTGVYAKLSGGDAIAYIVTQDKM